MSNERTFERYTSESIDEAAQAAWDGLSLKLTLPYRIGPYPEQVDASFAQKPVQLEADDELIYTLPDGAGYAVFGRIDGGIKARIGVANPDLMNLATESMKGAGYREHVAITTPRMDNETRAHGDDTGHPHPFASVLGYE